MGRTSREMADMSASTSYTSYTSYNLLTYISVTTLTSSEMAEMRASASSSWSWVTIAPAWMARAYAGKLASRVRIMSKVNAVSEASMVYDD